LRSFRQFPFRGFENQEYFTYGLSEVVQWIKSSILNTFHMCPVLFLFNLR
jgi:hypothetical protein